MPISTDGPVPYAPASSIIDVISRYRDRGLATPFTKDVLLRAGVSDSLVSRTLAALEQLDLTNEDGEPTEQLEGLRLSPEAEFQERMADWIRSAYAEVFQFVDPAEANQTEVRDAFRAYEPAGQQPRMVTLFLGLCEEAGIIDDARKKKSSTSRDSSRKNTKRKSRSKPTPAPSASGREQPAVSIEASHGRLPPSVAGLVKELPVDGKGWTQEDRDRFLSTFRVILDFAYPIVDTASKEVNNEHDE